jgi:hypothetical protein
MTISGGTVGPSLNIFGASEVNISGGTVGSGFRAFDSAAVRLNGREDGDSFYAIDDVTVTVSDGAIGRGFSVTSSKVEMTGGSIDTGFLATNSQVRISGGTVADLSVANGSRAELSDTTVLGGALFVDVGGVATVLGGTVNRANVAGELNLSGGLLEGSLRIAPNGALNLVGRFFELDGVSLDSLTPREPFRINNRNVELSGILADGSAFSFDLNGLNRPTGDYFDAAATLTVTLIPEPRAWQIAILGGLSLFLQRTPRAARSNTPPYRCTK